MAKHTDRDRVWCWAMHHAVMGDAFSIGDLKHVSGGIEDPPSDRTIRDVLNTMVDMGWLEKEKPQGHTWRQSHHLAHGITVAPRAVAPIGWDVGYSP